MSKVSIKNLKYRYPTSEKDILKGVSLEIPEGKVTALLGPNGSGKTTLMRIIIGYITPTSGTVYINGINILDNPQYARKNIGYLPENNPLYMDMYVYEYLHFIGSIKKTQNLRKRIKEVLEIVGLEEYVKFKIGALSKGYKQRVGLAAALINDPPILILDEPTSGLDPIQVLGIRNLIKSMSGNKTIIFSTHILPEAEKIADFIVIMHKGRLLAAEASSELSSLPVNSKIMVV
ncbi:MAG: ABC transporter ATP-binding protein, partial [Candidatus Jordarchaeaceae archaeon]